MSSIVNPSSGGSGGNSDDVLVVPFTYATGSPLVLQAVTAGQIIDRAVLILTTAFDDPAATLQVGTTGTPSLILAPGEVDVSKNDQYGTDVITTIALNDILILTITPGVSTHGAGKLFYRIK